MSQFKKYTIELAQHQLEWQAEQVKRQDSLDEEVRRRLDKQDEKLYGIEILLYSLISKFDSSGKAQDVVDEVFNLKQKAEQVH